MERSGEGLPWVRSSVSSKEHSRVTFFWAERSLEGSAPASPPSAQPARPAVPTRVGGWGGGGRCNRGRGAHGWGRRGSPAAAPDLHLPMASSTPVRAGAPEPGAHPPPESPPLSPDKLSGPPPALLLLPARLSTAPPPRRPGRPWPPVRDHPGLAGVPNHCAPPGSRPLSSLLWGTPTCSSPLCSLQPTLLVWPLQRVYTHTHTHTHTCSLTCVYWDRDTHIPGSATQTFPGFPDPSLDSWHSWDTSQVPTGTVVGLSHGLEEQDRLFFFW